jgi:predicted DNA-binding protein (MmcQ/YjbR family)
MDRETLRDFCRSLPAATEDIKWGNDRDEADERRNTEQL